MSVLFRRCNSRVLTCTPWSSVSTFPVRIMRGYLWRKHETTVAGKRLKKYFCHIRTLEVGHSELTVSHEVVISLVLLQFTVSGMGLPGSQVASPTSMFLTVGWKRNKEDDPGHVFAFFCVFFFKDASYKWIHHTSPCISLILCSHSALPTCRRGWEQPVYLGQPYAQLKVSNRTFSDWHLLICTTGFPLCHAACIMLGVPCCCCGLM